MECGQTKVADVIQSPCPYMTRDIPNAKYWCYLIASESHKALTSVVKKMSVKSVPHYLGKNGRIIDKTGKVRVS